MTTLPLKQETGRVQTRTSARPAKARFDTCFLQDAMAQPCSHHLRLCLSAGEKRTEAALIPRVWQDRPLRGMAEQTALGNCSQAVSPQASHPTLQSFGPWALS